jgi:DNA polymerase-3 subunit beta
LFAFSGKSLNFVATDGRRLARVDGQCEPVELNEGPEIQAIVAARHTTLMERTLFEQEGMVRVAPRQNDLMMHTPKATVFARLLEGRFPRWRDVFPQRSDASRIELAVGPFFAAVRQAAIATTKDSKGVDFAFTSGMVTLSSTAANAGDARVELPLAYDGPTIELSMNPGFLSDYLRVLDPQTTFTLEIKDAESPAVCLVPGGYSYVIMPMARGR